MHTEFKDNRRARGTTVEHAVAEHLAEKGYRLVEKNFQWRGGEIDLIFMDQNKPREELVFVEVRSAKARSAFLRHSIGPAKRQRLLRTIQVFRHKRGAWFRSVPVRFDLVWVEVASGGDLRFEHWRNVEL